MPTIILHHGLMGGGIGVGKWKWSSFHGLHRDIAAAGYRVLVSAVHPIAGVHKRGTQLRDFIQENSRRIDGQPVVLVTHSFGGLDARYMLSRLKLSTRIDTLLTISAPHHGSAYADFIMKHLGKRLRGIELVQKLGLDMQAVADATIENCARFNEEIEDNPAVRYYSICAAVDRPAVPMFARHSWDIITEAQGPNDGLVACESARWGQHLADWPANHWQLVDRRFPSSRKAETVRDILPLYLRVLKRIT